MFKVKKKINTWKGITTIIAGIMVLCFSVSLFHIFANYINDKSFSDFPLHIEGALDGSGYSLAHIVMKACSFSSHSIGLLSASMTLVGILTAVAIAAFIKKYLVSGQDLSWGVALVIGIISTGLTQIYIPRFNPHCYVHETLMAPNWHNSTFLFMRLFGWITLLIYFELRTKYMEKGNWSYYVLFTLALFFVNFAKPNFILSFAPMMLFVLIFDFFKYRAKNNLYVIRFGICVLISLSIVLIQTSKVYCDGSSIILKLDDWAAIVANPIGTIWNVIANIGFPLLVTVIILIKKNGNRVDMLFQSWGMFVISLIQKIFLDESGERMGHGNYAWGCYFFCQVLSIVALIELINMIRNKSISRGLAAVGILLFLAEAASGIMYFVHVLNCGYYIL